MRAAPLKNSSRKHYCAVIRFELSYLSILLIKRMAVSVAPPYRKEPSRLLIGILANFLPAYCISLCPSGHSLWLGVPITETIVMS